MMEVFASGNSNRYIQNKNMYVPYSALDGEVPPPVVKKLYNQLRRKANAINSFMYEKANIPVFVNRICAFCKKDSVGGYVTYISERLAGVRMFWSINLIFLIDCFGPLSTDEEYSPDFYNRKLTFGLTDREEDTQMSKEEALEKVREVSNTDVNDFKFGTCARCKNVYYCSRECQKKHWLLHKQTCREKKITVNQTTS